MSEAPRPLSDAGSGSQRQDDCGPKVSVKLPVLSEGKSARPAIKSKMGKWRAAVLILIHIIFVVHLLQWLYSGMSDGVRETVSPVEPSETMFTLEGGQVNAGFVMFLLALASTAIFGRFFCGWACHIVALQDLCGWMMKKIGVHPKPFRSRLLLWAPLCFALYMFVWPTLRREVIVPMVGTDLNRDKQYSAYIFGLKESDLGRDLNGDGRVASPGEQGDSVAGVPEEIVGIDLNGNGTKADVVAVAHEYPPWLGDVIPLHGFDDHFIVEDFWATFAPWQIAVPFLLVCGFMTVYFLGAKAFCSYGCPYGGFFTPLDRLSPLRIRVNDNCHQCGHCTAVCTSNVRVHEEVNDYGAVVDPGCMKCLDCVSVCPNDALSLGFGTPAVRASARVDAHTIAEHAAKAQKRWDLTLREELVIGLVFLFAVLGYRGMYKCVPILMAMGVASLVAFGAFKTWRMLRDRNVRGPFAQLKRDGRIKPAGYLFAAVSLALLAGSVQGVLMNWAIMRGENIYGRITTSSSVVFRPGYSPTKEDKALAEEGVKWFTMAGPINRGGLGFAGTLDQDWRLAWLNSVAGDFTSAEAAIKRVLTRTEPGQGAVFGLMQLYRVRQAPRDEVERELDALLARWPDSDTVRFQVAVFAMNTGRPERAKAVYDDRLKDKPDDTPAAHSAALIRLQLRDPEGALSILNEALKHRPKSPLLHERLANAMVAAGKDPKEAAAKLLFAAERQPTPARWGMLSDLYRSLGMDAEADRAAAKARELMADSGGGTPVAEGGQPARSGTTPPATK